MAKMSLNNQFDKTNITEICRACLQTCEEYKTLFDKAACIDKRIWADVFSDVVKIEIISNIETAPNRICITCSNDLTNAYNFIKKSQQNNERLLQYLNAKERDSLTEFPVNLQNDQHIPDLHQIKVEDEASHDYNESMVEDFPENTFDSDGSDNESFNKSGKIPKLECGYCNRIFTKQDLYENHMEIHREEDQKIKEEECEEETQHNCEECGFSCYSNIEMIKHQQTTHTTRSKQRVLLSEEPSISATSTSEKWTYSTSRDGDIYPSNANHLQQRNFSPGETFIIQQIKQISSMMVDVVNTVNRKMTTTQTSSSKIDSPSKSVILTKEKLIQNESDLKLFEKQPDEWKKQLRRELLERIGKRPPSEVRSSCLELCNLLISHDFWQNTSWTGGTRDEAKPKFALQEYRLFLSFFKEIIKATTDSCYSDKEFATFFQGKIKNRNQILSSRRHQIRSASRKRQKIRLSLNEEDEKSLVDKDDEVFRGQSETSSKSFGSNSNLNISNNFLKDKRNANDSRDQYLPTPKNEVIVSKINYMLTGEYLIRNEDDLNHFEKQSEEWKKQLHFKLLREIKEKQPITFCSSCSRLCNMMIDHRFWHLTSWTGGLRNEKKPKFAFQEHYVFLSFFKNIVQETTNTFCSDKEFANFFQNKMKNRNQVPAKITRIQKRAKLCKSSSIDQSLPGH